MATGTSHGTIIVCTGGDCRRAKGHRELLGLAAALAGSVTVPCQGICKGPVVGLQMHDEIRWYTRVRKDSRRVLEQVVRTGRGRRSLRSIEARGRRGKLRHPRRLRPVRS